MSFVDLVKSNQELLATIGSLSSLGFLITSTIALIQWVAAERRRRKLDEERAYIELNNRYLDYLKLAAEYPHLDVADYSLESAPRILSPEERLQQKILFSILTSILERTYLIMTNWDLKEHPEWAGWDSWINWWMSKGNYREFWENPGSPGIFVPSGQYSYDFEKYMERKYKSNSYLAAGLHP
jgi:hypothetical protein